MKAFDAVPHQRLLEKLKQLHLWPGCAVTLYEASTNFCSQWGILAFHHCDFW